MDGFSDYSDDNSDDVENIVGKIGDLENNLFRNSQRNISPILKDEKIKDRQKRVFFQDDDNNSVNDLLSDAIDSKQISKTTFGNSRDSKVKDLFKIETEGSISTKETFVGSIENNNTVNNKKTLNTNKLISNKSKTIAEATDGVKSDDFFPKQQFNKTKKSNLMNDLFGGNSKAASYMDISGRTSGRISSYSGINEPISESMPNLLNTDHQTAKSNSNGFTLTNSNVREPRRRNKSAIIEDPLGLLGPTKSKSTEETIQLVERTSDEKKSDENLPEWLGGSKKSLEKVPESEKSVTLPKRVDNENVPQSFAVSRDTRNYSVREMSFPDLSLLTGTQLEQQASLVALQQQEYELRTATILSQQTDQLNHIVESQKTKIDEQEKILNTLVQNQVDRQATLDTQIKMQQARIDHYIQALSRQPALPTIVKPENEGIFKEEILKDDNNVETVSVLHKFEIERENLQNIVDILRVKHETEIKILEESHETQMHFMRTSMEQLESRLQNETESLEKNHDEKIERLINEKNQLEDHFKRQIEILNAEHTQTVKDIHSRHSEQIKILQKEHSETIESISQAKELERKTVDFIQNSKIDLDSLLKQSQTVFNNLQNLSDKLNNQECQVTEKRENSLKRQEQHLQALEEHSATQREILENERKQLITTAHKLESETFQLTSQFKKNTEIYDETESRMKIREQALLREKELFSEQSKWEREHLGYMREAWNTEQKRQMQLLVEEREKFLAEKAQLEVLKNLRCSSDDITKAELEAALRTAQEAVKEANQEKERWQEKINSIETEKKRIQVKERQLMERAKELEDLTQSAMARREEGMKALKNAQQLEKQHNDRMNQLELQLEMLAHRENKIASEKLSLARDRLTAKTCQAEKPERDLEGFSLSTRVHEPYNNSSSQMQTQFSNVVDPQLILLKLNLDNKLDTSNQLLSDMQIFGH